MREGRRGLHVPILQRARESLPLRRGRPEAHGEQEPLQDILRRRGSLRVRRVLRLFFELSGGPRRARVSDPGLSRELAARQRRPGAGSPLGGRRGTQGAEVPVQAACAHARASQGGPGEPPAGPVQGPRVQRTLCGGDLETREGPAVVRQDVSGEGHETGRESEQAAETLPRADAGMKKGKNELLVVFANAVLRNIFLFRNAYVIHNDTMRQEGMMSLLFTAVSVLKVLMFH